MTDEPSNLKPIVRLTRWSVGFNEVGRVYMEHEAWPATDPLREEAQRAMFAALLANPATRDTVLWININQHQGCARRGRYRDGHRAGATPIAPGAGQADQGR